MSYINKYEERDVYKGSKKYKKKRKVIKADHKHDYEEVIGLVEKEEKYTFIENKDRKSVYPYNICRICGKAERRKMFFNKSLGNGYTKLLISLEDIVEEYPDLRVVEIDRGVSNGRNKRID